MNTTSSNNQTLAIIHGPTCARDGNTIYTHNSFGRIIEEFARRFKRIHYCPCLVPERTPHQDYAVPENVVLYPLPNAPQAWQGALRFREFARVYREAISQSDLVFVRGSLIPAIGSLYATCAKQRKPVCHWLVTNAFKLLHTHNRGGFVKDTAGKLYTLGWEWCAHRGRAKADGSFLCNGQEIADRHPSPDTHSVVSTTLTDSDFFFREDTCRTDPIRIICLSFIRPEKGIEYLIEAFNQISTSRPTELHLVGSRSRYPTYQKRLDDLIKEYNLEQKIHFAGNAEYKDVGKQFQNADIMVLPTLSEGTPRVLVEARANCTPVVASAVGGIPTSVTDGHDGLLVPPKQPGEIAGAIDRIIQDGDLRRSLILNGYNRVKNFTIDKFVDKVCSVLEQKNQSLQAGNSNR